jgi:hypothetical protein
MPVADVPSGPDEANPDRFFRHENTPAAGTFF